MPFRALGKVRKLEFRRPSVFSACLEQGLPSVELGSSPTTHTLLNKGVEVHPLVAITRVNGVNVLA